MLCCQNKVSKAVRGWRTLCKKSGSSLVGVVIVMGLEAVDWRFGEFGGVDESCVLLRLVFGVAGVGAVALPNISSWLADVSWYSSSLAMDIFSRESWSQSLASSGD